MADELKKLRIAISGYWQDRMLLGEEPKLDFILQLVDDFEWIYFGDENVK